MNYTFTFINSPKIPNTFSNQIITKITTTILKMFLILESIGMYVLTSHSRTPTIINTSNTVISGIEFIFLDLVKCISFYTNIFYTIIRMCYRITLRLECFATINILK